MALKTRTITTWYTTLDGAEPCLTVEVEPENARIAHVATDLDEAGVPPSEQAGVRARALEAYWELEHQAWLLTPEGEGA